MLNKPQSTDFEASIDYYLKILLTKGYSQHTIYTKRYLLEIFTNWLLRRNIKDLEVISRTDLDAYLAYLFAYRKKNNGQHLALTTIRLNATAAKVFLKCLYNKDVINSSEFNKFELPKAGHALPKPILSYQDVLLVLKQIPNYTQKGIRDKAIIECFYATGIRRRELVNLNIDDLDITAKQLRIVRGKGGKDRYVPICDSAIKCIKRYLRDVRPNLLRFNNDLSLFLGNSGQRFNPSYLSSLISKYITKANINKFGSCHQFRHAVATHLVDNDADIRHVQEFLGHSSISTTQVYVHVSKAKLRKVYEATHPRIN